MSDDQSFLTARRLILALALGGLLLLSFVVLRPFLVPIAWAGILASVSWPLYRRLRLWLRGRSTLAALLMTLLLTALFVLPVVWLGAMAQQEFALALRTVTARLAEGPLRLPDFVLHVPWLGEHVQELLANLQADPGILRTQLARLVDRWSDELITFVGGVGRNAVKLSFALLTLFFFYRDGETVAAQAQRVLRRFLGERVAQYLQAAENTVRAVVYGLLLTALAQGALAGVGYWLVGMNAPTLLGAITVLIALVPFGAPLIWGSIGLWLLLTGDTWAGVGLLAWGALMVSWVDNLVRPLVISNATRIPFLLVMFGVLGGVAAFGLIGLFVGPVILAVLIAVWREWLEEGGA
jgi:predicted PurR-regulated permease PerM